MHKALWMILTLVASSALHAADAPEAVYQKFHAAIIAKDFAAAAKHASSFTSIVVRGSEVDKMPLKALVPKSYRVVSTQIAPKGDSATLTLEGLYEFSTGPMPNAKGSIGLVKEGGHWKVDNGSWSSR